MTRLSLLVLCFALLSCGDDDSPTDASADADARRDGSGGDAMTDARERDTAPPEEDATPTGEYHWFLNCGDPSCRMHREDPDVPHCGGEVEGAVCTKSGDVCDPVNDCNAHLVCTDTDPRMQLGGCPISRRRFKRDIDAVDRAELERYAAEALSIPLATYRYRGPRGDREQLGFVIEDVEPSAAVDSPRDQVDLYGYTSLAIATVQVQQRRIEELEQRLRALEAQCR